MFVLGRNDWQNWVQRRTLCRLRGASRLRHQEGRKIPEPGSQGKTLASLLMKLCSGPHRRSRRLLFKRLLWCLLAKMLKDTNLSNRNLKNVQGAIPPFSVRHFVTTVVNIYEDSFMSTAFQIQWCLFNPQMTGLQLQTPGSGAAASLQELKPSCWSFSVLMSRMRF